VVIGAQLRDGVQIGVLSGFVQTSHDHVLGHLCA
jgi:hypothetical protein